MPSWDEEFSKPGYRYGTEPNSFLVEMAGRLPAGARVIATRQMARGATVCGWRPRGTTFWRSTPRRSALPRRWRWPIERGVTIETAVVDLSTYQPEVASADAVVLIYVLCLRPFGALPTAIWCAP